MYAEARAEVRQERNYLRGFTVSTVRLTECACVIINYPTARKYEMICHNQTAGLDLTKKLNSQVIIMDASHIQRGG